jgi:hypothetical protein
MKFPYVSTTYLSITILKTRTEKTGSSNTTKTMYAQHVEQLPKKPNVTSYPMTPRIRRRKPISPIMWATYKVWPCVKQIIVVRSVVVDVFVGFLKYSNLYIECGLINQ